MFMSIMEECFQVKPIEKFFKRLNELHLCFFSLFEVELHLVFESVEVGEGCLLGFYHFDILLLEYIPLYDRV